MIEDGTTEITDMMALEAFKTILSWIGEDPNRPGLQDTPMRYLKAIREMTEGYQQDPKALLNRSFEMEGHTYDEMILSRDIPFTSLCEHHCLPFHGVAHVAYIPQRGGPIIGLSKLARLVEVHARRLQVQERLCESVAMDIENNIKPRGTAVIIKGYHTCQAHRGVKKDGWMVTSAMYGFFRTNEDGARQEFLELIKL